MAFHPFHYILIIIYLWGSTEAIRCDRRPFRTTHPPTVSNGKFELKVFLGTDSTKYLPQQQYVVTLSALNQKDHSFTAFMVWPEGHTVVDPQNPRAKTMNDPGIMRVNENEPVKISDRCPNTIEMINAAPTTNVSMYWESPGRGNDCVTLHAMVAENDEVWYQDGENLITKVCEDDSFLGDMSADLNENCSVCEEAKYEIKFEGKWSRNTHPYKFPQNDWTVYYGDMIGASHSSIYSMWKDGSMASEGMKALALDNNTSIIEDEILENYAQGYIRTLIKGKGHDNLNGEMNDPTYALVRVDNQHHLISTAIALRPSPDWYLGISNFELCQENNTWLPYKSLDLIPWDAGVDRGISFESPKEPTSELIGRVRVGSFDRESPFYNMNYKQLKPFATLTIQLIRTYNRECAEASNGEEEKKAAKEAEPEPPARRTLPPPSEDSNTSPERPDGSKVVEEDENCPLSSWDEWTPCSNFCGVGYRSRSRHHIVNGFEYRYYKPNERKPPKLEKPTEECLDRHIDDTLETESCEGPCVSPEPAMSLPLEASDSMSRQSRTAPENEAQDCVMSSWSRWSACSGSCDEGAQMRIRIVIQKPSNGGRRCPRRHQDIRKCILDPCP